MAGTSAMEMRNTSESTNWPSSNILASIYTLSLQLLRINVGYDKGSDLPSVHVELIGVNVLFRKFPSLNNGKMGEAIELDQCIHIRPPASHLHKGRPHAALLSASYAGPIQHKQCSLILDCCPCRTKNLLYYYLDW